MGIVRRLFSMFSSSGRSTRGRRRGGGGLMSLVSRFLGSSRGRSTSRF